MKFKLTERSALGDDGNFYMFEADIDVATEDEAYVKGREFQRLSFALYRGLKDGGEEEEAALAELEAEDDEDEL